MRFFFADNPGAPGEKQPLDRDEAEHLFVTLRARPGDRVGLINGRGVTAEAEVTADRQLTVISRAAATFPAFRVHLFCASPRRKELDLLLKQAAETGAASVNLINCARSVATPDGAALNRWRTIVMEGCKQSHNPFAPEIAVPEEFADAVERVGHSGWPARFGAVRQPDDRPESFNAVADGDCALFIGPEGGFTGEEEAAMLTAGFMPWNFASTVLRLETAAAGGVMLLKYLNRSGGGRK
ncbi:MAG: RsmE family RNA methyltransferase [Victivallaceae bacterium]|nr:RsmE family RNA methyltransferase [Victivallaceae bacterium]